jgi:hypothetical protein
MMKSPHWPVLRQLGWWVMAAKAEVTAGYSGTPLWKKLGFKPGMKVCALNAPAHYSNLIDGPNNWVTVKEAKGADALHLFIIEKWGVKEITTLCELLPPATMLWVSWPKKTSPLSKGLSEDDIRATALACGLVDVKVCAVDADWSGLKLVLRASSPKRKAHATRGETRLKG